MLNHDAGLTKFTAYGKLYGVSDLGVHARSVGAWRLVRAFDDPSELERLRKALERMPPQQAAQVLGSLDPTEATSPVEQAETWGWQTVQHALAVSRADDESAW